MSLGRLLFYDTGGDDPERKALRRVAAFLWAAIRRP